MADTASPKVVSTETSPAPPTLSSLKKSKAKTATVSKSAAKKTQPKKVATHPKTSEMVLNAIIELKERKGSSLQAIKKHIAATYKVDSDKLAIFIRNFLKKAVASGELTQTKGTGASGSFKIATAEKKTSPTAAVTKKVAKKESPEKKVVGKKTTDKKKSVKSITRKERTSPVKKSVKSKTAKTTKPATKEKKSVKKLPTAIKAKSPKVKKVPASKPKKATAPKKK